MIRAITVASDTKISPRLANMSQTASESIVRTWAGSLQSNTGVTLTELAWVASGTDLGGLAEPLELEPGVLGGLDHLGHPLEHGRGPVHDRLENGVEVEKIPRDEVAVEHPAEDPKQPVLLERRHQDNLDPADVWTDNPKHLQRKEHRHDKVEKKVEPPPEPDRVVNLPRGERAQDRLGPERPDAQVVEPTVKVRVLRLVHNRLAGLEHDRYLVLLENHHLGLAERWHRLDHREPKAVNQHLGAILDQRRRADAGYCRRHLPHRRPGRPGQPRHYPGAEDPQKAADGRHRDYLDRMVLLRPDVCRLLGLGLRGEQLGRGGSRRKRLQRLGLAQRRLARHFKASGGGAVGVVGVDRGRGAAVCCVALRVSRSRGLVDYRAKPGNYRHRCNRTNHLRRHQPEHKRVDNEPDPRLPLLQLEPVRLLDEQHLSVRLFQLTLVENVKADPDNRVNLDQAHLLVLNHFNRVDLRVLALPADVDARLDLPPTTGCVGGPA
eukprot:m.56812 g.56812  ORF g.56812 m.56812 type:complete len:493 (-) comp9320_c0_seq2:1284-2762(-)